MKGGGGGPVVVTPSSPAALDDNDDAPENVDEEVVEQSDESFQKHVDVIAPHGVGSTNNLHGVPPFVRSVPLSLLWLGG